MIGTKSTFKMNKRQKAYIRKNLVDFPVEFRIDEYGRVFGRFDLSKRWVELFQSVPF